MRVIEFHFFKNKNLRVAGKNRVGREIGNTRIFFWPSHLLSLHSQVCVGPGQKSKGPVFSRHGSYLYYVAKTNVLISLAITAQLICVFVFEYGKSRFLHDTVHMEPGVVDLSAMKPTRPQD